jgi:hypothetical protein
VNTRASSAYDMKVKLRYIPAMNVFRAGLIFAMLAVLTPGARADVNVKLYRQSLSNGGADQAMAEAYITGAGLALEAANAELRNRHQSPLFCSPDKLALNSENYRSIVDAWITKRSRILPVDQMEQIPVYLVLMHGLIDAFPCSQTKARQ